MALNGTFSSGQKFGGYTYNITWSASQSVSNNTSTITCTHSLVCAQYYDLYIGSRSNTCTVNGVAQSFTSRSISTVGNTTISLGTTTHTINHNTDGTATFNLSAVFSLQATIAGTYRASISVSGSATLDTIARASTISSATNVTLGNKCSIKWTPSSTSFKYKIKFSLGTWSYTTGYIQPGTTSAYTYTGYTIPTTDIYELLPNSTSGTMNAVLTTYNSAGTQIGSTSSKSFTVSIPTTVKPTVGTITLKPADINSQKNILVQGKNEMTISVSGCSAGSGSKIKSYTFSGPNLSSTTKTTTAASSSVSGVGPVTTSGALTYTVKVTDTRGRTTSKTQKITCHGYTNPSISGFNAYRSNSSGTSDPNGKYLKITYTTVNYSSVNSTNKATVVAYYTTGSTAKTVTMTSASKVISLGDADKTYTVYLKVTDSYDGSSTTTHKTVFGGTRILNVSKNGTGIAFGKLAEYNNRFECVWPTTIYDNCNVQGRLTIGSSTQTSTPTNGIHIHDVRDANITPDSFGDKNANFYFDKIGSRWSSIMHLKGWANSTDLDYAAWELAGNAHFNNNDTTLKYRSGAGDTWSDWYTIATSPTTLFSSSSGISGTVKLSSSAANFTYLEIFYADNHSRQLNIVKVYSPDGKYVTLSCVEPSTSNSEPRLYIKSSGWTISGTTMAPGRSDLSGKNSGIYAQIYPSAGGTNIDTKVTANNYIKIIRVLGYK